MKVSMKILIFITISAINIIYGNFLPKTRLNSKFDILNKLQNKTLSRMQEDHPCEQKTDMILKKLLNQSEIPSEYSDYYKFAFYSGTGLNDLGDYFGCEKMNISKYFIMQYSVSSFNTTINLKVGLCYFKECDQEYMTKSKNDIANLVNTTLGIDINPNNLVFIEPTKELSDQMDRKKVGLIISMCVIGLIVGINLLQCYVKIIPKQNSTLIYDVTEERKSRRSFIENEISYDAPPSTFRKVLGFFDVIQNKNKIFEVKNLNETYEALRIFDGVRVLSTCWVVFGHTTFIPFSIGMKNMIDIPDLAKQFRFAILLSGVYAVDVFFYMSAFLLYFSLQKYFNKKINKFQIFFMAIINRYIRLLPIYLFVLFAVTYMLPFLGSGPNYFLGESCNQSCGKYFWHNLLYFNNIYDYKLPEIMCASHSWYLANDMQFFILSMAIFLFLNNHKIIRNLIFTLIFTASNAISIIVAYQSGYRFMDFNHAGISGDFFGDFYEKPWIRICPYILGLYFCEFFLETPLYQKDYNKNYNGEENGTIKKINSFFINSNVASFVLFLISIILINFSVFSNTLTNLYDLPIFWHVMFITFNKTFFVFGLGCIIHLTFLGKFEFIRNILSFNIFTYISRITYGIYLIHIYVIIIFLFSFDSFMYLKFGDFVFMSIGIATVTTVISFIVSIILESPVINASKYFLEGRK